MRRASGCGQLSQAHSAYSRQGGQVGTRPWRPEADNTDRPHPACVHTRRCARRGGCDNCARRAAGGEAERDLGPEAGLLLAAVGALRGHYGAAKPVALLRGSRGRDMAPWMLDAAAPDGARLHGPPARAAYGHATLAP